MKKIQLFIALLGLGATTFSQNCELPVKQGQQYKLSSISYDNPIGQDIKKWIKTKPEKQQEIIDEHNASVVAGKLKPKYTFDMVYNVAEVDTKDGFEHAKMVTTINKVDYTSHISCKDDTFYFARRYGFQESLDPQGKKIGYAILGVSAIPKSIKVGDHLPPYTDIMFTYPNSQVFQMNVVSGSGSSYAGFGMTKSWVEFTPVEVLETKSFLTIQIQNAKSEVTGTTDFTLNGRTYTAYIIESETWTKTYADFNYKSDDSRVAIEKMNKKINAHWEKVVNRKLEKAGMTNDEGFIVTPKTEWYVPELGMINLIVKFQGFISNETKLVGLE